MIRINRYGILGRLGTSVTVGITTFLFNSAEKETRDAITHHSHRKESDDLKNKFVALASYNLRSPLTVIKGYLQVLAEGPESRDYAVALKRVNLAFADFETQSLRLIELADLASDKMKFSFTVDSPEDILTKLAQKYTELAKEHSLKFIFEYAIAPHVRVKLDPEQFSAALENLTHNAIKYNTTGTYIKLSATNNKDSVLIFVQDNSGGVPKDIGDQKGTGLGLFLSQRIIEAHGGHIRLNNKPPSLKFIVAVPIFEPEKDSKALSERSPVAAVSHQ